MWKYFNPNPDGLNTIDCTVRAICAVTGWSWYKAHDVLCERSREMSDMPSSDRVWWSVLKDIGFKYHSIRNDCEACYTVADFARDHPIGSFVVGPHEHAVAVINGNWMDSWDSGSTVPIYYFGR